MLRHPNFDPVALWIGPLSIKWYGLTYLIGFAIFYWLGRRRIRQGKAGNINVETLDDILFYGVLGVILGGRLGYVLFYKPAYFFSHPLEIPQIWTGGMSFHGGFLGVLIAILFVARKHRLSDISLGRGWLKLVDFLAPLVPPGLASVRIGNFINGELYGRVTDVPWGMVFNSVAAGPQPRHPSQLYQSGLEGITLFIILWIYSSKSRPLGAVSGMFLLGYGCLRFIAEYFREPDDFLGLLTFNMSMGQWLSLPMVLVGAAMVWWAYRQPSTVANKAT
jgi:phosphatidylglycerol---prolipoprotein diacylglyceryl transferase